MSLSRVCLVFLFALIVFFIDFPALAQNASTPPNIVIIPLADDLWLFGYRLLRRRKSRRPISTNFAAEGLRFTDFHNTSLCCPSRASLLTGLYSHQTGMAALVTPATAKLSPLPSYQGFLNDSCVTLAEVLDQAGYFTAMAGKWHVGQEHGVDSMDSRLPTFLGFRCGVDFIIPTFPKPTSFSMARISAKARGFSPPHWYTTDVFTDYALKFLDEAQASKKPFFSLCGL